MQQPVSDDLVGRLEELNSIGVSLSKEKDISRLLEKILIAAKSITNADGGTLYRINEEGNCQFEIMRTDSLNIAMGGTTGVKIPFYPIHLIGRDGLPNNSMVVAYAVLHDRTVNIPDAYAAAGFDFSGTKNFDKKTGYRSRSFLTVPLIRTFEKTTSRTPSSRSPSATPSNWQSTIRMSEIGARA